MFSCAAHLIGERRKVGTDTFKYNPFGQRIEKISPTTTSMFAYDGDNLVETMNASGSTVARYTLGRNTDELLAMQRGSTTNYYETDGLNSITSLSNAAGALAQTYTFDSFGNTTNSSGSLTNFFRYTAREFDTETNLYYYRARYYDPTSGRFVSEDPIRFRGGANFYAYVHNRPTILWDPSGRLAWGGGVTISGVLGAFWFGGGVDGSCLVVGDLEGNTGLLCCAGIGGGAVAGVGASVQGTSVVCPTCKTICDMEGGYVQGQAFGGLGLGAAGGAGVSLSMQQANVFVSGGPAVGGGAGVVVMAGSCKLVGGGKACKGKNCPLSNN